MPKYVIIQIESNVEESSTSVIGDKHPAGWSPVGDRAIQMSSFSMRVMAVNISIQM